MRSERTSPSLRTSTHAIEEAERRGIVGHALDDVLLAVHEKLIVLQYDVVHSTGGSHQQRCGEQDEDEAHRVLAKLLC